MTAGDARLEGGRWGLGRWFSPSRPPAIDPTTPAPPPDIVSSPYYHPPSENSSFREDYPRSGSYSGGLYPPPETSGYTTAAPQPPSAQRPPEGEALYPPPHGEYVPNAPQNPLSGVSHGLGHSFHQVADPLCLYTAGEPRYPPQEHGEMQQYGSGLHSGEFRA